MQEKGGGKRDKEESDLKKVSMYFVVRVCFVSLFSLFLSYGNNDDTHTICRTLFSLSHEKYKKRFQNKIIGRKICTTIISPTNYKRSGVAWIQGSTLYGDRCIYIMR